MQTRFRERGKGATMGLCVREPAGVLDEQERSGVVEAARTGCWTKPRPSRQIELLPLDGFERSAFLHGRKMAKRFGGAARVRGGVEPNFILPRRADGEVKA